MSTTPPLATELDRRPARSRILIVDDDAVVRGMTRELLRVCGCEVADLGVPGRVAAWLDDQTVPVDALFVDVSMPLLSGPELIERLGARIRGIPLVFMTGEQDPGVMRELQRTYPAEVLHKPFTLRDLRAVLQRLSLGTPTA